MYILSIPISTNSLPATIISVPQLNFSVNQTPGGHLDVQIRDIIMTHYLLTRFRNILSDFSVVVFIVEQPLPYIQMLMYDVSRHPTMS